MADTETPEYEAAYQAAFAETPAEPAPATTDAGGFPVNETGRDVWQGRASDPGEIPTLGVRDGKFHFTFKVRDLDSMNDPGQLEANQLEVERQALNLGWLLTEPAQIAATIKDETPDTRGGGAVTYAAPCVQNALENRPV